jgi:1,4-dihydroxy-2-naphthoyl-CoA synthase
MGLVNTVVPLDGWRRRPCLVPRDAGQFPMALRCLKAALNADCDGQAGLQELAGNATLLYYMRPKRARRARRPTSRSASPDFKQFKRFP